MNFISNILDPLSTWAVHVCCSFPSQCLRWTCYWLSFGPISSTDPMWSSWYILQTNLSTSLISPSGILVRCSSFFLVKNLLAGVDTLWENLSPWSNSNFLWAQTEPYLQTVIGNCTTEPICSMLIRSCLCQRFLLLFSHSRLWSELTWLNLLACLFTTKLLFLNSSKTSRSLHN